MTRYAKLTGRKPEYSKSSAQEDAENLEDSVSKVEEVKESKEEQKLTKDDEAEGSSGKVISETSKLLKRAKLLRLKLKKAKTPEKKKELQKEIRETEGRARFLNGQKSKDDVTNRHSAPAAIHKSRERLIAQSSPDDLSTEWTSNEDQLPRTKASQGISNPWKAMEAERRAKNEERSAHRREKRAIEREATTRCFACREFGHAAKDCPKEKEQQEKANELNGGVVCCHRCGSTEHSLAKCRKPTPKTGSELPFAHCFICQKRGHLASKCAENKGRGIYPDGGSCKLCKSVDHLAKNCPLNEAQRSGGSTAASTASIGFSDMHGKRTGADEDDFHAFSRKRTHSDMRKNAPMNKKPKVVSF